MLGGVSTEGIWPRVKDVGGVFLWMFGNSTWPALYVDHCHIHILKSHPLYIPQDILGARKGVKALIEFLIPTPGQKLS